MVRSSPKGRARAVQHGRPAIFGGVARGISGGSASPRVPPMVRISLKGINGAVQHGPPANSGGVDRVSSGGSASGCPAMIRSKAVQHGPPASFVGVDGVASSGSASGGPAMIRSSSLKSTNRAMQHGPLVSLGRVDGVASVGSASGGPTRNRSPQASVKALPKVEGTRSDGSALPEVPNGTCSPQGSFRVVQQIRSPLQSPRVPVRVLQQAQPLMFGGFEGMAPAGSASPGVPTMILGPPQSPRGSSRVLSQGPAIFAAPLGVVASGSSSPMVPATPRQGSPTAVQPPSL